VSVVPAVDAAGARDALYVDGITGRPGAFSREWGEQLAEDLAILFGEALRRPNGALGRGPRRYYCEIHPERLRGFPEIATNPWLTGVCEEVLGADYEIIEVGFDVPLPGAFDQPWHRDFVAPRETFEDRLLTSLAFNMTAVDVTEDMGPFEIAPGTQWEDGADFEHGMFPPRSEALRYAAIAERKLPRLGDASVRTALTIHRGTANHSWRARPVLIVGVVTAGGGDPERHHLQCTRAYHESLPDDARAHLPARIVDSLEPIEQEHTIEGLVMGER
jgi:Phytanoyl-CoA dioxygenase (PhyH)